jgi:hypothetical protein
MFIRVRTCFGFFAICNRGFGVRYEVVAGIYFRGGMLRGHVIVMRQRRAMGCLEGEEGRWEREVSWELGCWVCFYGVEWVRRRCGFGKEESCLMHNSTS